MQSSGAGGHNGHTMRTQIEGRRLMREVVADHARDWLTLALAGLGITFAPHEWIGGMFLALAGASYARHIEPEQDRRELWAVMVAAFIASHAAAMMAHQWYPGMPVQLVMLGAGFFSRRVTRWALRFAGLVEDRGDVIAGRALNKFLPDDDPKK